MKHGTRTSFLLALLVSVCLVADACVAEGLSDVEQKRDKLIGYMLDKKLPSLHFSHKEVDDDLSAAAFDLYLKQLDFQKRFLLRSDVAQLGSFRDQIDDNLARGTIILPGIGYEMLNERIGQVEKMVEALQQETIDPDVPDKMETDPEKLDYAADLQALKRRWRVILKAQIINRYLDLEEERQVEEKPYERELLWREARDKVAKRFAAFFHRLRQERLQDHYDRYFNAVARAFDPHTNYMAPDYKEDFDIHMRGSLEGIGALLREEDGYIKVVRIIPGSASAKGGSLQAEDIILAVAERGEEPLEISDMRLRDAVRLIRGPKGSEVRLTVRKPDGAKRDISIVRDVVQIEETFVKQVQLEAGEKTFGYINIPVFYRDFEKSNNGDDKGRNTTDDTKKAIREFKDKGISGIILDLRNNGGGSLMDAVDVAGLFIHSGPIVQVKNSYGQKLVLEDDDDSIEYDGPLVVLVNQFSASASEIVAAALQDYRRAIIVGGKHTHGKGTVQRIVDLNKNVPFLHLKRYDDLGALKATIQKFYRVNGGSTQYRGVEPDIVLPSLFQNLKSGEKYLENSLKWDQVEPVDYQAYTDKIVDLKGIIDRSRVRIAKSEGLQLIKEEAERSATRSEQTVLFIDLDSMREKRDEERTAREKIGAHYRRLEEEQGVVTDQTDEPPEDQGPLSDAEWSRELAKDPYVSEAEMIINDLANSLRQ